MLNILYLVFVMKLLYVFLQGSSAQVIEKNPKSLDVNTFDLEFEVSWYVILIVHSDITLGWSII